MSKNVASWREGDLPKHSRVSSEAEVDIVGVCRVCRVQRVIRGSHFHVDYRVHVFLLLLCRCVM